MELLKRLKQGPLADVQVIMMTAYGSIPVAVEAMKLGAFDFVTTVPERGPVPPHRRLQRQRQETMPEAIPSGEETAAAIDRDIVGVSEAMARVNA